MFCLVSVMKSTAQFEKMFLLYTYLNYGSEINEPFFIYYYYRHFYFEILAQFEKSRLSE